MANHNTTLLLTSIGTPVTVGSDIQGTITGIKILPNNHVMYEVSWWDGRTHNCKYLEVCEVTMHVEDNTTTIGFNAAPTN